MNSITQQENVERLHKLIKGIKIAMLTTVNQSDGSLHSRPMGTQETEFDGDLWFFTKSNSQKINEITENQAVSVSYTGYSRYVSVSGTAQVIYDRAKMKNLWSPIYQVWFPDGLNDPSLRLLKIHVDRAEYWENPGGLVETVISFAAGLIHKDAPKMGENETITLRQ